VEPMHTLDWKVKVIRNRAIDLVKFQWTYYGPQDAMWEHKETMQEKYLQIFENFEENWMYIVYKCVWLHIGNWSS